MKTSKALAISETLSLPLDTVTDTIGVLAVKGGGKTYTFLVLVEEMIKAGLPIVVIDVVGVCWGLRTSADGKRPGLPVTIVGGEHGDVPLEEGAGEVLADWVLSERRPVVIDVSCIETKAAMQRFALAFFRRLYHGARREPVHVFIDEADEFCPQRPFGDETQLLRAVEVLVRRGRAKGIGETMATQRPATINKNVLTQIGTLIVGRMTSPQDRKAVEEWVDAHATKEQKVKFMASLASLPVHEKWIWSPARDVFAKVKIRARETFDSSSTPKVGEVRSSLPKALAPVDLVALRARIAATTLSSAKKKGLRSGGDDALVRRVADLERELAQALRPRLPEPLLRVVAETLRVIDEMKRSLVEALARFDEAEGKVVPQTKRAAAVSKRKSADAPAVPTGDLKLRTGERRMLEVLARHHPKKLNRLQLGTLSGIAGRGTTFSTYLNVLLRHGLIDVSEGLVALTEAGVALVGEVSRKPMKRAEILEIWKSKLRSGEGKMLDAVVAEGELSREDLGSIAGIDSSGTTFSTYINVLKRNDLVVERARRVSLGTALAEARS